MPPLTYGLTHIAVKVNDLQRTKDFYCKVFDMEVMYDEKTFIQLKTRGCHDILVFEKKESGNIGNAGGIIHYGFRLRDPGHIHIMAQRIRNAGGNIKDQGEFVPGSPYIFFHDPDGYEVEVWFEAE
jgi:catechol 2,3-dioxygenase-like lactoylglutathione lyase family enzyme